MDDPLTLFPPARDERPREANLRSLRRRLWTLLAAGGMAFVLTTWTLVRLDNPPGSGRLGGTPASVVRAHLEALNRGELRAAYGLFSRRYREEVSFEAFHQLVATHGQVFHTRLLRFGKDEESGQRAVLETHLLAEGGEHYLARYTLVRAEDRWWIDDLRWSAEPGLRKLLTA